jgi:glycosyltransferase involved in cell wall biosynthesis
MSTGAHASHPSQPSGPFPPLRAGFLIDTLRPGAGTENQLLLLLRHFDRKRLEPRLACLWDDPALATLGLDHRIEVLGFHRLLSPAGVRGVRALRSWIRRERLDVLVTFFKDGNQAGVLGTRGLGLPILSSRRNLGQGYWHSRRQLAMLRRLNAWCAGFVTNSEAVARYTVEAEGVPADRIALVPNAVDTTRFRPASPEERAAFRRSLDIPPDAVAVGCVSNLRPIKGVDVLIEAWPRVRQQSSRALLLLAGDGSRREALKERTRELGVSDSVRFLGSRPDVPEVLRGLDLAVLPSRGESFSNSLLEFMAAGLPPVATRVGGNAELIESARLGRLVPSEDPASLAGAVLELAEDGALRRDIGIEARRHAVARHALAVVLERWYAVLEAAAKRRQPSQTDAFLAQSLSR